jgi:cytochrome oxidase assembly protein ShyY1
MKRSSILATFFCFSKMVGSWQIERRLWASERLLKLV